jgi:hypothetical protein
MYEFVLENRFGEGCLSRRSRPRRRRLSALRRGAGIDEFVVILAAGVGVGRRAEGDRAVGRAAVELDALAHARQRDARWDGPRLSRARIRRITRRRGAAIVLQGTSTRGQDPCVRVELIFDVVQKHARDVGTDGACPVRGEQRPKPSVFRTALAGPSAATPKALCASAWRVTINPNQGRLASGEDFALRVDLSDALQCHSVAGATVVGVVGFGETGHAIVRVVHG